MTMAELVVLLALIVVGLPVVLGIGGDIYKRRLKFQERKLALMADRTAEKAAQYAAQVERLEQRMRVLERIATDRGYDVATQIEALRDQRRVEEMLDPQVDLRRGGRA